MNYGTYTLNTVVKITAAGMHTRTPNYSIIGGAVSMGPSGNASVAIGASGISITQGGAVEPTATVYATVSGNVTKGQRDGYPVREYAGFFGVWCGPTYGPRCDDWSGATTITLERLVAGLSVNAESTVVSPGSIPYFDYRASPETVDGNGMPLVPDSSHWIPDPDYVWWAIRNILGSSWKGYPTNNILRTVGFNTWADTWIATYGYRRIDSSTVRRGDVVSKIISSDGSGHTGLFSAWGKGGKALGIANNGSPAFADSTSPTHRVGNVDYSTSVVCFGGCANSSHAPLFLRAILP
jgi:hypothetical protein